MEFHNYRGSAVGPRSCSYGRPHALEPLFYNKRSHFKEPLLLHHKYGSPCSPQLEKSPHSKEDPAQPKINEIIFLKRERGKETHSVMEEKLT